MESLAGHPLLTGPATPITSFDDQTIRQVMNLRHGGSRLRIKITNEFGARDLILDSVMAGRSGGPGEIIPGSQRRVTFDGLPQVIVHPGATRMSDPIDLSIGSFEDVVVDLFAPESTGPATVHANAGQTFYVAAGDRSGEGSATGFVRHGLTEPHLAPLTTAWYYVSSIEVDAPGARTIVAFGDSITDGLFSTGDSNQRYPDVLARRLHADPRTADLSLVSQAISAGRLLHDGVGPSGLDRFDEALGQPNVAGIILLLGINDIGQPFLVDPESSADDIINGYRELAERAHARGVKIFIGTLLPAGDLLRPAPWGYYSTPEGVAKRWAVNSWIRGDGRRVFDGVIDFDRALRNPVLVNQLQLRYDSLDSLHPNDAGYAAMARAVPLDMFARLR